MKYWPHAPSKSIVAPGTYMITAATLHKDCLFDTPEKLDLLHALILETALELDWELQAWAVFANHYHVVGHSPDVEESAKRLTGKVHGLSAIALNRLDGTPGRRVWFNMWDTLLTYERSYYARLAYVHLNPVKHGIVDRAEDYRWCSATWFQLRADRPFYETVMGMKIDKVNVYDEF